MTATDSTPQDVNPSSSSRPDPSTKRCCFGSRGVVDPNRNLKTKRSYVPCVICDVSAVQVRSGKQTISSESECMERRCFIWILKCEQSDTMAPTQLATSRLLYDERTTRLRPGFKRTPRKGGGRFKEVPFRFGIAR